MIRFLIVLGCLCQISGIGLVFWQVARLESLFPDAKRWWARPDTLIRAIQWLKRKFRKPQARTAPLMASGAARTLGSAQLTMQRARTGPYSEQLASLWSSIDDVYREIEARCLAMKAVTDAEAQARNQLKAALTNELERQAKLIQQSTLGSRKLQVFGSFLIIVGVALLGAAAWIS